MADFGKEYIEKKRKGAQNARRLSANSIARAHLYAVSNFVMEASLPELKMRVNDVQDRFKEFDIEHKIMMSFIAQNDTVQLNEQDAYYAGIENKYLAARAALVTIIDNKEKIINDQIAEIEDSNRRRFGTVVRKNRAHNDERSRFEPEGAEKEPEAGTSSGKSLLTPLEQLELEYRRCGLNSDSETEIGKDATAMSDDEVDLELGRYESEDEDAQRSSFNQITKGPIAEKSADNLRHVLTGRIGPRTPDLPQSAVNVVNPAAHEDLRNKLKRGREHINHDDSPEFRPGLSKRPAISCFNCCGVHPLYRCTELLNIPLNARIARVKALNLCENCFLPLTNIHNNAHVCRAGICKRCRAGYHNSILCPATQGN